MELTSVGALDAVIDLCVRQDWIEVCNPSALREGQVVRIMAPGIVVNERGKVTVLAISQKYKRVFVTAIPPGTALGDSLVVDYDFAE